MKGTGIVVLASAMVGAISACGDSSEASKAPSAFCGHSIASAPLVANVIDATRPGAVTVTELNRPGRAFVRLSTDCAHGGDVGPAEPASSLEFADEVPSDDGRIAALVVQPVGRDATLTITRPGGQTTEVKFRLANLPPCNGTTPC